MKLQRIVSRKVSDKTYYKWQVTLPPEAIEALRWKEGDELEPETKANRLLILKKR